MNPKRVLRLRIEKAPVGYVVYANIGFLGLFKTVAALTTRTEAVIEVSAIIEKYLAIDTPLPPPQQR